MRPDWLQNPPGTPINSKTTARPRATCSAATPPRAPDGTRRTPTHAPSRPNTNPRGTTRTATRPASRPASPRAHGRPRHTPAKVRPADRRAGPACGTGRTARRPPETLPALRTQHTHTHVCPRTRHAHMCSSASLPHARMRASAPAPVLVVPFLRLFPRVDGEVHGCRHHRDVLPVRRRQVSHPRAGRGGHGAAARRRARGPRVHGGRE